MRCPKCSFDVPPSDYVCGKCGAYARKSLTDPQHSSAARDREAAAGSVYSDSSEPPSIDRLLALQTRRAATRWARWSMVLAALALLFPVFFGPIGFASGYVAWRLGERRLGSLGAALSAIAMIAGVVLASIVLLYRSEV